MERGKDVEEKGYLCGEVWAVFGKNEGLLEKERYCDGNVRGNGVVIVWVKEEKG